MRGHCAKAVIWHCQSSGGYWLYNLYYCCYFKTFVLVLFLALFFFASRVVILSPTLRLSTLTASKPGTFSPKPSLYLVYYISYPCNWFGRFCTICQNLLFLVLKYAGIPSIVDLPVVLLCARLLASNPGGCCQLAGLGSDDHRGLIPRQDCVYLHR